MVSSIQSDEARHAQIGAPVLATVVEARSRLRAVPARQVVLAQLAAVRGRHRLRDGLPDAARAPHELVQGVHARVGARSVPALARRVRPRAPVVLGHLPRGRSTTTTTWSTRARTPTARRSGSTSSCPGPQERAWLREKYPGVVARLRSDLGAHHRALARGRSRQRLRRARHGDRVVLRSLPARAVDGTPRANTANVLEHGGRRYIFCSRPCRWIFEQEPERYAAHKDVVKRVLAGEAPANLVALVQRYFGLDYDTWGKDAFGGDYPWLGKAATRRTPRDPALRLSRRRHDRAPGAGARPTTRSPSSRASCRRRRGCAPRSTVRSR